MKILVIGPSWVGDMMMSHSLYRTLKTENPETVIDVMAPAWCRPLLSRMPEVNQALPMPLGHGALQIAERRRLVSRCRRLVMTVLSCCLARSNLRLCPFSPPFHAVPAGAVRCVTGC